MDKVDISKMTIISVLKYGGPKDFLLSLELTFNFEEFNHDSCSWRHHMKLIIGQSKPFTDHIYDMATFWLFHNNYFGPYNSKKNRSYYFGVLGLIKKNWQFYLSVFAHPIVNRAMARLLFSVIGNFFVHGKSGFRLRNGSCDSFFSRGHQCYSE